MKKINNNSQTKDGSKQKPVLFLIALLIGLLIVAGVLLYIYKKNFPKQTENQSSTMEQIQSEPAPESVSAPSTVNLTGKWSGKYTVTSPAECSGFAGSWTANIKQDGNSFSGSYKSDALVNGVVSGKFSGDKDFDWTVTGGGGAQLKGSIISPNKVTGNFTGPKCPITSQLTSGTFSGGR